MIIIIGAGLHGLSVAYHLLKKDVKDVVIIEMVRVGYGSSSRNAGRFRYNFYNRYNIEFAIDAINYLKDQSRQLDFNPLIYTTGYLWILNDEELINKYKLLHSLWSYYNVSGKFIECKEYFSYLKTDEICYFAPHNGSFHHDYLLYSYYNFIKNKYRIVYDKVEKIVVEFGKVKGVKLASGSFLNAEKVIVTAGAWSSTLFNDLGINIPIFPERRELYLTEDIKFFIEPLIIDHKRGIYFSQTLKGEIIGGLDTATGKGFVPFTVSFSAMVKFLKELRSLVDRIKGIGILRGWSGYYEMTPDHSHIIGQGNEWPEGLYIDAGYSGHGAMFSAFSGKILSEYIIDGKRSKYLDIFSPDRFEQGKLVEEKLVI